MFSQQNIKRVDPGNPGMSTWLAFLLLPLAGFATDIYIPSMPSMATSLNVSSISVQSTLTVFLISYGVSQLFLGSILDSFGRYRIGIISLIIFAFASFTIANAHMIWIIYIMRMLQGFTAGAVVVAKRAYFVDVFTGDRLKHYLSMFSIIWSAGPIIAPFLGGYLQSAFGWRSNFYFLGSLALLLAAGEYFFNAESLKVFSPFRFKSIVQVYRTMLGTVSFTSGIAAIGICYSLVMVYNMTAPFIIEHHLQLTPVVAGYCALISGIAWMIGGFIGKGTIRMHFMRKILTGFLLQCCFAVAMRLSFPLTENIFTLMGFAFAVHVCAGFAFNVYFTFCLTLFPGNAGIASGLTGGLMYTIVSAMSYGIVYFIPAKDQRNLSYSYLLLIGLFALVLYFAFIKRKKETAAAQAD